VYSSWWRRINRVVCYGVSLLKILLVVPFVFGVRSCVAARDLAFAKLQHVGERKTTPAHGIDSQYDHHDDDCST
jgi:hypothetical protein